jgi:hypothetical protein
MQTFRFGGFPSFYWILTISFSFSFSSPAERTISPLPFFPSPPLSCGSHVLGLLQPLDSLRWELDLLPRLTSMPASFNLWTAWPSAAADLHASLMLRRPPCRQSPTSCRRRPLRMLSSGREVHRPPAASSTRPPTASSLRAAQGWDPASRSHGRRAVQAAQAREAPPAGGSAGGPGTRGATGQQSRVPPLRPRLKMTPAVGPTLSAMEKRNEWDEARVELSFHLCWRRNV